MQRVESKFGYKRLFEIEVKFSDDKKDDLRALGQLMTSGTDPFNSPIPSGYTYLGQFIDHDISHNSKAGTPPNGHVNLIDLRNERSPFLDLDSLYGKGPEDQNSRRLYQDHNIALLKLGSTIDAGTAGKTFFNDLPRNAKGCAEIEDKRNDENMAVAQTHVAFIKFHNAVVRKLGSIKSIDVYKEAKEEVTRHYEWIVLNDYLPRIINQDILKEVCIRNTYFEPNPEKPEMPIEFSAAAFRLGHSMVRPLYTWNRFFNRENNQPATLLNLGQFTGFGKFGGRTIGNSANGLVNITKLPSEWIIDWRRFFEFNGPEPSNNPRFNFALKINTKLSSGLGRLSVGSLAVLNLLRGLTVDLPTGQLIAERVCGDFKDTVPLEPEDFVGVLPLDLIEQFNRETPLWFYLLAEAEIREKGERLGPIGSRIVAEAFVGLLKANKNSILNNTGWEPQFGPDNKTFNMTDLLRFVAENTSQDCNELNPLGD